MESRKMILINLSAGKEWDTNVENKPVDAAEEGEGGTNWESSIDMYTLHAWNS